MDLQTASRSSGLRWQIARIGGVLFLVLACGLLVASLLSPVKASFAASAGTDLARH